MPEARTKAPKIRADELEGHESQPPDARAIETELGYVENGLLPIALDWLQNKLYSKSQQWLNVSANNTLTISPAPQNIKRITVNVYNDKRRTLISKFTSQQPIPVVTPATSSSDDRSTARECEHLLRWVWRDKELSRELDYLASDVVDCGGGWWQIVWDPQAGVEKEVTVEGEVLDLTTGEPKLQKVKTGDVAVNFVSNFEMRVDPSAMRLKDAMWLARISYLSTEVVERKWGKEVQANAAGTRPTIITADMLLNPQRFLAQNICRIVEQWHRATDEYPTGYYVVIADGDVLHFEDALPDDDFPFIYCEFDPDADNFYGSTPMSAARRPQTEFNGILSQMADGRARGAFGSWLAARGCGMDIPTGAPHEVIGYNDTAKQPQFVQPQPVADQIFRIGDVFGELIGVVSGVSDQDATSGKDRLYAAEQDNTKLGPALRSLHMFLKRAAMKILNLYRDNATFDIMYAVSDHNAESDVRAFMAKDIRYSAIEMSIDSALPLNRQAKRDQIVMLMQVGLFTREQGLKAMEMGDLEDLMGTSNLDRERARNENLMLTVHMVNVEDFEDHAVHLEEHLSEMKQQKWYLFDDEVKLNFRNHVNLHKQFIQMQLGMGGGPQNQLTGAQGGGNNDGAVGNLAQVPATDAANNSTLPVDSPVSPQDNAALGVINGSQSEA